MPSSVPTTLHTERLLLRAWRAADAATLLPVLEANVARLAPWIPANVATPVPVDALGERLAGFAADFAADRAYRWALLSPDEAQLLGEADLFPRASGGRVSLAEADRVEIGYWLDEAATGRGLATEATQALLGVAAALPRIAHAEIRCDVGNAPSAAVPQRLGFSLDVVENDTMVWRRPLGASAASPARVQR